MASLAIDTTNDMDIDEKSSPIEVPARRRSKRLKVCSLLFNTPSRHLHSGQITTQERYSCASSHDRKEVSNLRLATKSSTDTSCTNNEYGRTKFYRNQFLSSRFIVIDVRSIACSAQPTIRLWDSDDKFLIIYVYADRYYVAIYVDPDTTCLLLVDLNLPTVVSPYSSGFRSTSNNSPVSKRSVSILFTSTTSCCRECRGNSIAGCRFGCTDGFTSKSYSGDRKPASLKRGYRFGDVSFTSFCAILVGPNINLSRAF